MHPLHLAVELILRRPKLIENGSLTRSEIELQDNKNDSFYSGALNEPIDQLPKPAIPHVRRTTKGSSRQNSQTCTLVRLSEGVRIHEARTLTIPTFVGPIPPNHGS